VAKNVKYLMLVPGVVLILFFLILPLAGIIFPTFFDGAFSLQNYTSFFTDSYNTGVFTRTLRIALIVTLVSAVLGIPASYFIASVSAKWKGILMAMTLFPLLTNSVIRSFAWITILGKNGVINTLLLSLGLIKEPLTMLYTEFSVIVGSVYLFLPTMIMTLVGVMETIDGEVLEAAETLGASPFTAFRKIVLPLSFPGVIIGSILVFTGTLTAYTTPQLLGGNKNMMLATMLYQKAMTVGDWQASSVIAFIMILSTIVVMKGLNLMLRVVDRREAHA